MRQDFEDEEDLYGEFLDKSDETVLWPSMLSTRISGERQMID